MPGNEAQNKSRLLIVDDAKPNIDILVHALEDEYKLGIATSGQIALDYVLRNQTDLILLDIMMPGMDGYEVCARLKDDVRTHDIPVLFVTAMDHATNKAKGFALGAVDYITKPFDILEVKARVRTHLALEQARHALQQANSALETRVAERTAELEEANLRLEQDIAKRKKAEEELLRLSTAIAQAADTVINDNYF